MIISIFITYYFSYWTHLVTLLNITFSNAINCGDQGQCGVVCFREEHVFIRECFTLSPFTRDTDAMLMWLIPSIVIHGIYIWKPPITVKNGVWCVKCVITYVFAITDGTRHFVHQIIKQSVFCSSVIPFILVERGNLYKNERNVIINNRRYK